MARRTPFGIVVFAMWCIAVTTSIGRQPTAPSAGPQFDVVSIKLNPGDPSEHSTYRFSIEVQFRIVVIEAAAGFPIGAGTRKR
jgi:hypothetical protein